MSGDLEIIKKLYGEKMMHLCRGLFSTLLEKPGLLSNLFLQNFAPSRFLYEDIIENYAQESFKDYIYSLVDAQKKEKTNTKKTPKQLMAAAGYDLYECKTEQEIQYFKKYYAKEEKLCTFHGGRLDSYYVFCSKKNCK